MDADIERRPDPRSAATAAEFLHALQRLRAWAGQPSLRTLTRLAGTVEVPGRPPADVLPVSTISDNLNGKRLPNPPRHAFVTAFVTACLRAHGVPEAEIAADLAPWTETLQTLSTPSPDTEPAPAPAPDPDAASVPPSPSGADVEAPDAPDLTAEPAPLVFDAEAPGLAPPRPRVFGDAAAASGIGGLGAGAAAVAGVVRRAVAEEDAFEGPATRMVVLTAESGATVLPSGRGGRFRPRKARLGLRKTQQRRPKARPVPIVTAVLGAVIGAAAVWGLMPAHMNGGTRSESPPGAAVSPSGGSSSGTVLPGAGSSGPSGNAPGIGNQGGGSGPKGPTPSGSAPGKKSPAGNSPSTAGGDTQTANNPDQPPTFKIPTQQPQQPAGGFDPRKEASKYDPNKFHYYTPPKYP
ncbi:hypothetical protein [Actinomadura rupiterrae]|uniref:hypothetical protein n=1 Tax=Actinomadura rupiterrae TaxID=559627 RepID=UPI0020A59BA2|nr:hypothetical protein [Actinomadura rupiterrae]MCP2337718.1 hypothetical protein [Actinomadura rupiterrae]